VEKIELQATTRNILGKKVRFLRRQGHTPVHLFGHGTKSLALQCETAPLKQVLAQAGKTKLVHIKVDKSKRARNVVVREVQKSALTDELLHVDFYQVRLTEKLAVEIPITTMGEAPALKAKDNFLTQELNNLSIECLPDQIPERIEVDISILTDAGRAIYVKDIKLDKEIAILDDPEQLVYKISAKAIEVAEVTEEAPEAEEAVKEEAAPTASE